MTETGGESSFSGWFKSTSDDLDLLRSLEQLRSSAPPPAVEGFRLAECIGRGGMGVVFAAEQEKPRRQVAIKFLRSELVSPAAVRRFEREARLLARLKHPCFVPLHCVGEVLGDTGPIPFLVMDRVDGDPLTDAVDERALDQRARVGLLREIADAVATAHAVGVLHRDLKPANVLVEPSGRPRVLDFGVGCSLDADTDSVGDLTRGGELLGTPAYMSPEQLRDPSEADARSDLYSLGIMLRELLTEEVRSESLPTDRVERRKVTCRFPLLSRHLDADLRAVMQRALANDPVDRYPDVASFVADLDRWLGGRATRARRDVRRADFVDAVRRRGLWVGLVLLVVATMLGAWWAIRPPRAENAQALGSSRPTTEFLTEWIGGLEAMAQASQSEARARLVDALNGSFDRMAPSLEEAPELRVRLLLVLSSLSFGLGEFGRSEERAREAVEAIAHLPSESTGKFDFEALRARVLALVSGGRESEASEVLALTRGELADAAQARIALLRARTQWHEGRGDLALKSLREADGHMADHSTGSEGIAREAALLRARVLCDVSPGLVPAALAEAVGASTFSERIGLPVGVDWPRDQRSLYLQTLAEVWLSLHRLDKAIACRAEALSFDRGAFGVHHSRTLWSAYLLAQVLLRADRPNEALACLAAAMDGPEDVFSEQPVRMRLVQLIRAEALVQVGDVKEAERWLGAEDLVGNHVSELDQVTIRLSIARLREQMDMLDQASTIYRDCLDQLESTVGLDHVAARRVVLVSAALSLRREQPQDALAIIDRSLEAGGQDVDVAGKWDLQTLRAQALYHLGRVSEAVPLARGLVLRHPPLLSPSKLDEARYNLAVYLYDGTRENEESRRWSSACLASLEARLGAHDVETVAVRHLVADQAELAGEFELAASCHRSNVAVLASVGGASAGRATEARWHLLRLLEKQGQWAAADDLLAEIRGGGLEGAEPPARWDQALRRIHSRWEASLVTALELSRASGPVDDQLRLSTELGFCLRRSGRPLEAVDVLDAAHEISWDHEVGLSLRQPLVWELSQSLQALGRIEDASDLLAELRDELIEAWGPDHPKSRRVDVALQALAARRADSDDR